MSVDSNMNEFTLIRNVAVGIILMELMILISAYFISSGLNTGLGCTLYTTNSTGLVSSSINGACQLQHIQSNITSASQGIGNSFNNATTSPLTPVNDSSYLGFGTIANLFIVIPNVVFHLLAFVYNVVLLVILAIYMIIFVMVDFIPAIFLTANLGIFGSIFTIFYGAGIFVLVMMGFYIVANRLEGIKLPGFG